jgi:branched-chain amino acid transport system permease protein
MTNFEVLIQQLITGFSNGMIIALIALGYTMVYGIIELINFAHGDLFMLGAFFGLTLLGLLGADQAQLTNTQLAFYLSTVFICVPCFCALINFLVNRFAYQPLRNAPRLAPLVSAIGVSFIFLNIGLFWGGLPLEVFNMGRAAAAPKDFPMLISNANWLGDSMVTFSSKDLLALSLTVPLMALLTLIIKYTTLGKAMRAVAQDPGAAKLMGINVERIIGLTFVIGGFLGGVASMVYALYNNTISFQMGYRVGIDAFTAAVLGGIGNLPGAVLGGLVIGVSRALSDQYIATQWTNTIVFTILIVVLVFRPAGLLGTRLREKV